MRKIKASQILVFIALLSLAWVLGVGTTWILFGGLPPGDFRGLVLVASAVLTPYLYALLIYRIFIAWSPLESGEIAAGSKQEFVYHVYLLFYLLLFYPVMRSGFVPVPLMRLLYQALGARLGANTYSSGIILDPGFVEIGSNCIVGQFARSSSRDRRKPACPLSGPDREQRNDRRARGGAFGCHHRGRRDCRDWSRRQEGNAHRLRGIWGGVPASLLDRADKSGLLA